MEATRKRAMAGATAKTKKLDQYRDYFIGARDRTRTGTAARPRDFKSLASTNFATRADGHVSGKGIRMSTAGCCQ